MGYTSIKDDNNIVKISAKTNCPVTIEDNDISKNIFGPNIYTLKRNTIRTKPKVVVNYYIDIPQEFKNTHQNIEFFSNITYMQGHMFIITISKIIKFISVQDITDRNIPILNKAFDKTFRVYN